MKGSNLAKINRTPVILPRLCDLSVALAFPISVFFSVYSNALTINNKCSRHTSYWDNLRINAHFIENDKPYCFDDFLLKLKKEAVENPSTAALAKAQIAATRHLRANVHKLVCIHAGKPVSSEATFINDRVFVTGAHSFYVHSSRIVPGQEPTSTDKASPKQCYVEYENSKGVVSKRFIDDRIAPHLGNPNNSDTDMAVAAISQPLEGFVPIPIAEVSEIPVNAPMIAGGRVRDDWKCFSAAHCTNRDNYQAVPGSSAYHFTSCPLDYGQSGGGVIVFKQDRATGEYDYKLAGIMIGGAALHPDGSPYNDETNFTGVMGLTEEFKIQIDKMIAQTQAFAPKKETASGNNSEKL
jgi:hypothetical protein